MSFGFSPQSSNFKLVIVLQFRHLCFRTSENISCCEQELLLAETLHDHHYHTPFRFLESGRSLGQDKVLC